MSIYESLPKANAQNVHQVKGGTPAREGPSRGLLAGGLMILVLAFLFLCAIASLRCRIETDPRFRLVCPPASDITPDVTTTTTSTATATQTPTSSTATATYTPDGATQNTATPTPTPTSLTNVPPISCTLLTARPAASEAAVQLALSLSEQFLRSYGVRINAFGAVPFNPICVGTDSDQLLGMIAPAVDENQIYRGREVEGIFYINDPRLVIETIVLLNKTAVEYSTLPLGSYMLACNHQRLDDCIAISLQGQEFQIRPESIHITNDLAFANPPRVAYEEGSIRKCFYVGRRRICIKVF